MIVTEWEVLDEGNCGRAIGGGEEACGWLGKRRVCCGPLRPPSPLGTILVKAARRRTETSYKAGQVSERAHQREAVPSRSVR